MMRLLWLLVALALLAGCPADKPADNTAQPASAGGEDVETANDGGAQASTASPDDLPGEFFPEEGPPRQLVILYTGDTLSHVPPRRSLETTEGGLSALAHTIGDYQTQIVDLNRLRVGNEGGDPQAIKADLVAGLLGEHPFLLLDYGGWARPNDPAGDIYVQLYFRLFTDFHYSAVGSKLYFQLAPERWQAYTALDPAPRLLATTPQVVDGALPRTDILIKAYHGTRWGIAAVPLPPLDSEDPLAELDDMLDYAQQMLRAAQCDYSILLMAEAPTHVYREHAESSPFTVIIGGGRREAVAEGYGELGDGALLLPELDPSGRELGVCHLYWPVDGDAPVMYLHTRPRCTDDETQPWPYRKLTRQASEDHAAAIDAFKK